jgi:P pilus assembly chaperone PapD
MTKLRPWLLAAPLAVVALLNAGLAWADPALLVSPTRVVFDGNKRTAVLTLLNNGTDTGTYRLFLVHYRMKPDGSFEEVTTPNEEELAVDRLIRFTPKQVVLPPKQAQVVRIQIRKPESLAVGEYRTHLLFRVLPTIPAAEPNAGGKGLSIRLVPAVGVSIPLIVREGATTATATIDDLAVLAAGGPADDPLKDRPRIALQLERTGNQSIYGNLVASFTPKGGAEREVARANGVAVYVPLGARRTVLPLAADLAHGVLKVTFLEPESDGKVLAQAELTLP